MKPTQLDMFSAPPVLEARRISRVYHNTTAKKGVELEQATIRAGHQSEKILRVFQQHPHTTFTPWDIHLHLGQQLMITSIRRAITTLTDAGYLVKTQERRKSGPAEETNCTWKLKSTIS
jgi:hypothetical protein